MLERADAGASGARPPGTPEEDDDGEGGSAAAELAVLLPVYMSLIVVTLTLGQFVLIRQKIAMTVHLQAWTGSTDDVTNSVFQAYSNYGSYKPDRLDTSIDPSSHPWTEIPFLDGNTANQIGAQRSDFLVFSNDLPTSGTEWTNRINEPAPQQSAGGGQNNGANGQNSGPPSASDSASYLATLVLGDASTENGKTVFHPHLQWRAVRGVFTYAPAFMPAVMGRSAGVKLGCTCLCLARKRGTQFERKVYRKAGGKPYYVSDRNPIEDLPQDYPWAFPISRNPNGGGASGNGGDNTDYRFLPPEIPSQSLNESAVTPQIQSSGGDPGIWNKDLRLGGSEDQEWSFFKQQLGL